jgi:hypothetical protein
LRFASPTFVESLSTPSTFLNPFEAPVILKIHFAWVEFIPTFTIFLKPQTYITLSPWSQCKTHHQNDPTPHKYPTIHLLYTHGLSSFIKYLLHDEPQTYFLTWLEPILKLLTLLEIMVDTKIHSSKLLVTTYVLHCIGWHEKLEWKAYENLMKENFVRE